MARNVKFSLKMANGELVRDIDELKAFFDIESVLEYFKDGRLMKWVRDRYYDDLENKLNSVSHDDADAARKLCEIFGVEYVDRFEQAVKFFNGDGVEKDVLKALEILHRLAKIGDQRAIEFLNDDATQSSIDEYAFEFDKKIPDDIVNIVYELSQQGCGAAYFILSRWILFDRVSKINGESVRYDYNRYTKLAYENGFEYAKSFFSNDYDTKETNVKPKIQNNKHITKELDKFTCVRRKAEIAREMLRSDRKEMEELLREERMREKKRIEDADRCIRRAYENGYDDESERIPEYYERLPLELRLRKSKGFSEPKDIVVERNAKIYHLIDEFPDAKINEYFSKIFLGHSNIPINENMDVLSFLDMVYNVLPTLLDYLKDIIKSGICNYYEEKIAGCITHAFLDERAIKILTNEENLRNNLYSKCGNAIGYAKKCNGLIETLIDKVESGEMKYI